MQTPTYLIYPPAKHLDYLRPVGLALVLGGSSPDECIARLQEALGPARLGDQKYFQVRSYWNASIWARHVWEHSEDEDED